MSIFTDLAGDKVLAEADKNYYSAPAVTYGFKVAANATGCCPRKLVAKAENDLEIRLAGPNDDVLGVLGFEYAPNCERLKNIVDIYAHGMYAPVIVQRGLPLTLLAAPNQYISLGSKLYASNEGTVAASGIIEVGVALETVFTGDEHNTPVMAVFK
jgi:hypothetical protein